MPRNDQGVYSLPVGNPVVTGTTITSTWANGTMPDIGNEITASLPRDGSAPMTGPLVLPGNATVGLQAVPLQQFTELTDEVIEYRDEAEAAAEAAGISETNAYDSAQDAANCKQVAFDSAVSASADADQTALDRIATGEDADRAEDEADRAQGYADSVNPLTTIHTTGSGLPNELEDLAVKITSEVLISGQDWAGVAYVDPDSLGGSPTAKIYPGGTVMGSTDKGFYTKFPDGTLLMYFDEQNHQFGTSSIIDGQSRSPDNNFGYPCATVGQVVASVIVYDIGAAYVANGYASLGSDVWVVYVQRAVAFTTGQVDRLELFAIGRWK